MNEITTNFTPVLPNQLILDEEILTRTYHYGDYCIDTVTSPSDECYEAWLYHPDYGVKALMIGVPKAEHTYEYFIDLILANIDEYVRIYADECGCE